jgi:hypothetical protein
VLVVKRISGGHLNWDDLELGCPAYTLRGPVHLYLSTKEIWR